MEQVRRHSVGAGAAAFPWSRVPCVLLAGSLRAHCRDSGWAMCERNMLRNQKLSGQSRTFFFHIMLCHHVTPCGHVMSSCHVIMPCPVIMSRNHVMSSCHAMCSCHVIIPCHHSMSCHHVTPCGHVMPSCHVITPCHVVMSSCHVPSCVCPRVVYVYDHMARQLQVNTEPVYVSVCFDQACLCLCVCPRVCALVWCRSYGGGGGGPRVRKLRGHW